MSLEICTRCRGTGYASAARDAGMEDAPFMLQPLGVYECPRCGGSGNIGFDIPDLTDEEREEVMLKVFKKIADEALK